MLKVNISIGLIKQSREFQKSLLPEKLMLKVNIILTKQSREFQKSLLAPREIDVKGKNSLNK